jgi:hypothetical protein
MTATGKYNGTRSPWDPEVVRPIALTMLVTCGGNVAEASRRLKAEHGLKVNVRVIKLWRDQQPLRYEELRKEHAPRVEAALVEDMLENAVRLTKAERMMIEHAVEGLEKGDVSAVEAAKMARDFSQARTQNIDKRQLIQGKPTAIKETRSLAEIVAALEARGLARKVDVTSTAIEIEEET